MVIIIFYSLAVILLFIFLYFSFVFYRSIINIKQSKNSNHVLHKISLVIALKNEAHNITGLINSLLLLNYPPDLLEIILVDDNSTDGSYGLISKLTSGNGSFKII